MQYAIYNIRYNTLYYFMMSNIIINQILKLILFIRPSIRLTLYKKLIESILICDHKCQRLYVPSIIVSWRLLHFSLSCSSVYHSELRSRTWNSAGDLIPISLSVNRRDLIIVNRRYASTMRDNYFNYPLRPTTNELHLYGGTGSVDPFSVAFLSLNGTSIISPLYSSWRSFAIILLRFAYSIALKSKIHNHFIFPSLFISLLLIYFLLLSSYTALFFLSLFPGTYY